MIKKSMLAAALVAAATASHAAGVTVNVDYEAFLAGTLWYTGTFSGTDTNNDGLLSMSELTSFTATQQAADPSLTLSDLSSFGDFKIGTDTWQENGYYDTYMVWNNFGNGLGQFDDASVTTTITSSTSAVPEPTSLAMMGLGALALLARRKRNAA